MEGCWYKSTGIGLSRATGVGLCRATGESTRREAYRGGQKGVQGPSASSPVYRAPRASRARARVQEAAQVGIGNTGTEKDIRRVEDHRIDCTA